MTAYHIAFSAGAILLYCGAPLLAPLGALFGFSIVLLLFSAFCRKFWQSNRLLWRFYIAIVLLLMGFGYASLSAEKNLSEVLSKDYVGQLIWVQGQLCALPEERQRYIQYTFCDLSYAHIGEDKPGHIRKAILNSSEILNVHDSGLCWRMQLKLRQPRSSYNPWVSSYEQHLFYRNVSAIGSIKRAVPHACGQQHLMTHFSLWLLEKRLSLSAHLDQGLHTIPHAGVLRALVLGDKSQLNAAERDILDATGTQHLMAISGLHVGLVMWMLLRVSRVVLRGAFAGRIQIALVTLGGLFYILLVGFSPSAQRAWVMVTILILYQQGYFPQRIFLPLIWALFLILLIDPLATLNTGFWYSFGAVALILYLIKLDVLKQRAWALFQLQMLISVGVYLLSASFGQSLSVWSIPANIVAIPWVSFVILPCTLLLVAMSYFLDASSGFAILGEILVFLFTYLDVLAERAYFLPSLPSAWLRYLFALCFLSLLLFRNLRLIALSASAGLLVSVFLAAKLPPRTSDRLIILDAGQGLSIFMESQGQAWVYDLGPKYERFVFSERVLFPLIKESNSEFSGLIVSHGDNDHAGGFAELLSLVSPKQIWLGEMERFSSMQLEDAQPCSSARRASANNLRIEVLYPQPGQFKTRHVELKRALLRRQNNPWWKTLFGNGRYRGRCRTRIFSISRGSRSLVRVEIRCARGGSSWRESRHFHDLAEMGATLSSRFLFGICESFWPSSCLSA